MSAAAPKEQSRKPKDRQDALKNWMILGAAQVRWAHNGKFNRKLQDRQGTLKTWKILAIRRAGRQRLKSQDHQGT